MPVVTSTGLGSGLDINNIVTSLVEAEQVPVQQKIDKDALEATEQISALGLLNSSLSSFKSSYSTLSLSSSFSAASISNSHTNLLSVTTDVGADLGSYDLSIEKLAQTHTIASASFTSPNDVIGTGEMTVRFGTYNATDDSFTLNADETVQTITIDSTNNTLSSMRDHINEGNYGVKASVINDGSGYRLVFESSKSGADYALEITTDDDDGTDTNNAGLSQLVFSASDKNMTKTVTAQDAELVMNGLTVTRSDNTVTGLIEGVTLNLLDSSPGESIKLVISRDSSSVEDKIRTLVDSYNTVYAQIYELTKYTGTNEANGVLIGDATVRGIQSTLRSILNSEVDLSGSDIHTFADLGIITTREGTLEIQESTFTSVLSNNINDVADFFTAAGRTTDSQVDFFSSNSLTEAGTYAIEVTQLATQGVLTGTVALGANTTIDADNDTFKVRIDGILSNEISLLQGTYTQSELIAEIQSKINSDSTLLDKGVSVSVTLDGSNQLVITSDAYGSSSSVAFTEVDTDMAAELGLSVASGTEGVDVEGTIDGQTALGDGQFLLSESGNSSGIKVQVTGGATGARGTVTYSPGMVDLLNTTLDAMIDKSISSGSGDIDLSEGIIDTKIDSLYKKLQELDKKDEDLKFRMSKLEARLFEQFNAMDIVVSQLAGTSSFLQGALEALPGYAKDKK